MNPMNYVFLSALLFSIGASGVLLRRNAIVVFMCVELMLNATNLAFVTFARMQGNLDGQVIAFFVMVVAAAQVVVGLGDDEWTTKLAALAAHRSQSHRSYLAPSYLETTFRYWAQQVLPGGGHAEPFELLRWVQSP